MQDSISTAQPINPAALSEVIPEDFLPPIHRWQRLGGLTGVVTVITALVLSQVVKVRETVKAPVVVRPAGELRLVEATAAGRVSQILVQENDRVNAGDAIAFLNDTDLQTKAAQLRTSTAQVQQQIQQIDSQLQLLNQRIAATTNQIQGQLRATTAELNLVQQQFREDQLIKQADLRQLQAEVKLAQENVERYGQLVDQGAIAISQLREHEVALEAALANLAKAEATAHTSSASVIIAQQQFAQTQAQGNATLAQLQQELATLNQRRSDLLNQLSQIQQSLTQTESDIALMTLKAPATGIIQSLELRNQTQIVAVGEPIAEIAAVNEPLIAKAWVPPKDINNVRESQTAQLRISACPYTDYGTLKARVQSVSPDTISPVDGISNTVNSGLYEVTLQLSNSVLSNKQTSCNLQAGMSGRIDILTRKETILKIVLRKLRLTTQL